MKLKDLFDAINAEFGFQKQNQTLDGIPLIVVHCANQQEFRHVLDIADQFPEINSLQYRNRTYSSDYPNVVVYLRKYGANRCTSEWKWSVPYEDFIRIYNDLDNETNQPAVCELPPAAVLLSQMQI